MPIWPFDVSMKSLLITTPLIWEIVVIQTRHGGWSSPLHNLIFLPKCINELSHTFININLLWEEGYCHENLSWSKEFKVDVACLLSRNAYLVRKWDFKHKCLQIFCWNWTSCFIFKAQPLQSLSEKIVCQNPKSKWNQTCTSVVSSFNSTHNILQETKTPRFPF